MGHRQAWCRWVEKEREGIGVRFLKPGGVRRAAARLPVGYKILLPFLALTLASGLTFATAAALELATGATAQADALLVRQGDATAERIASFGDSQLVALQLLTGAPGLADAVAAGDRQGIQGVVM